MIVTIKDFINQDQADSLYQIVKKQESCNSSISNKSKKNIKQGKSWFYAEQIHEIIFKNKDSLNEMQAKVTCGPFETVSCNLTRYSKGDFYKWHMDATLGEPGTESPNISYTIFLNDEYDGGELEIETPYGIKTIKEPKNTAVFYPSTLLHRIKTINSGTREVVIGWLHSLVKNESDRFLLSKFQGLANEDDLSPDFMYVYTNLYRKFTKK